jgi:hypothetical protein
MGGGGGCPHLNGALCTRCWVAAQLKSSFLRIRPTGSDSLFVAQHKGPFSCTTVAQCSMRRVIDSPPLRGPYFCFAACPCELRLPYPKTGFTPGSPSLPGVMPKWVLWLGWAQMTKKVPHTQPRPSQQPSKSVLATEKWALESPTGFCIGR